MRNIIKNKKGIGFENIIIMVIIIFALAIAAIIFSKVFLEITDKLKDTDKFSNRTIETMETVEEKTIPLLDFMVFFSLVGLMIGLIIGSIYWEVHPAIVMILIIVLIVAIFLGGQLANVYSEITSEDQLSATSSEFTLSNVVLGSHFPIIILVTGIIIIIIIYGKSRRVADV